MNAPRRNAAFSTAAKQRELEAPGGGSRFRRSGFSCDPYPAPRQVSGRANNVNYPPRRARGVVIVLHAGEIDGSLALWGESAEDGAPAKKAPRGAHPFAASWQDIQDALRSHGVRIDRRHSRTGVWLPSSGGRPLPSGWIAPAGARPRVSLKKWTVEAAWLRAEDAAAALSAARGSPVVAGMAAGPDFSYWADVFGLAASMVARQQILPDLEEEDGVYSAAWRPVLTGRDHERFAVLAKRMPAAARAVDRGTKTPPSAPPAEPLRRILSALVDHMARSAASAGLPPSYSRQRKFDSAHDAWLHGLRTQHSVLADPEGAGELASCIGEWQRTVAVAHDSPFRLCFRLEEPGPKSPGRRWFVRYLVQSRSDPSLVVPADEAGDEAGALGKHGPRAKEFLLTALGHVSGIVEGMSGKLDKHGTAGYSTDVDGAYKFLIQEAPVLEQLGYGIILPSWWVGGGAKARLAAQASVTPSMRAKGNLTLGSIVKFDWKVSLGDQKLTVKEMERLVRAKAPLVSVRGQWVETGSGEIRKAVKFLSKHSRATLRESVMMELGAGGAPEWLDLSVSSDDARISGILDRLKGDASMEQLPQPDGFSGELRPYQVRGYSWLAFLQELGFGGCLADDMGLGKTVQMLALIQQYKLSGGKRPVLLVCPTSVMGNWQKEAARFAPGLSAVVHHGAGRKKNRAFARQAAGHDIVISSYALMYRDGGFVSKVGWGGAVLDEAQNVKNPDTKQARAARSLDAGFKFALTGTPVENNVGDVWSIMEFLNPGLLGTRAEFKRRFFVPIHARRDDGAMRALRRAIGPFMLRRLKTDKSVISDLPKKMEMNVYCSLTKEQASLYASVLADLEKKLKSTSGIERRGIILATLSKLKQVCNHPAHFLKDRSAVPGRSGKLARLTEMLGEVVESGERALVFTQFVEMGEILKGHVQEAFGREALFLHGGVTKKRRDQMVERFQGGGSSVLIVSLKAGGTGLNLTAANHVFHFDRWWNPAVENQATDRAFRIGQRRNVHVYKMICAGTMEERINELIEGKKRISETVVGAGEGWLTKLSDRDIRQVLALSGEATKI